eukprot:TRINITY_DN10355_c0_g1_i1.p1 TRINITY_DN10355_c0_g1~~TRINITY_DN10355_c0_g1_i1.p1  ORF type:complete len:589 (+),score=149.70 TRINITY_DN10355_c0_g1_i1:62-1768(+)
MLRCTRLTPGRVVGIIGAGPGGLVAARHALDEGLTPVIYEKRAACGGVWGGGTGGKVWPGMRTNLSKHSCQFRDHAWGEDADLFPTEGAMREYLEGYVERFGLAPYIRYDTEVVAVVPAGDFPDPSSGVPYTGGWRVATRPAGTAGAGEEEDVDCVIVASGIFGTPAWPRGVAGAEDGGGGGAVVHAQDYKGVGARLEGSGTRRVLVLGGSLTGVEIAADVAKRHPNTEVVHAFRRPFYVVPRMLPCGGGRLPLDLVFYTRKFYGSGTTPVPRPVRLAPADEAEPAPPSPCQDPPAPAAPTPTPPTPTPQQRAKHAYLLALCSGQQDVHPAVRLPDTLPADAPIYSAVSDGYLDAVRAGRVTPVCEAAGGGRVMAMTEHEGRVRVEFSNAEAEVFDVAICATGYKGAVGYLAPEVRRLIRHDADDTLQPAVLYMGTVHPGCPTLCFVGFYKGPYFPVMELQALWAARLFAGRVALPSAAELAEGLAAELAIRAAVPRPQFPHPDYVAFADRIACLAGEPFDLHALRAADPALHGAFLAMSVTARNFTTCDAAGQVADGERQAQALMEA